MINDLLGVYNRFFSNSNSSNSITPDNSKYISHIYNLLDKKVDKIEGKSLSTNDYTDNDKKIVSEFVISDDKFNRLRNIIFGGN